MATGRFGACENTIHAAAMTPVTTARNLSTRPGSRAISRVAIGMPMKKPTICMGSETAATMPRCTSLRPKTSS